MRNAQRAACGDRSAGERGRAAQWPLLALAAQATVTLGALRFDRYPLALGKTRPLAVPSPHIVVVGCTIGHEIRRRAPEGVR